MKRRKWVIIGIGLLILAVMLSTLSGCARKSEGREVEATEPPPQGTSITEDNPPPPGETVVSAVNPGQPAGPTLVPTMGAPAGQTPVVAPAATPMPGQATAMPAPPGAQPADTSEEGTWHTVQAGETLASIARKYGTTWQAIAQANSLTAPYTIHIGQKLKIPTSSGSGSTPSSGATGCRIRHVVRPGEWVWQIARNYGVSPYDILAANGMTIQSARVIYPGTVLCIP